MKEKTVKVMVDGFGNILLKMPAKMIYLGSNGSKGTPIKVHEYAEIKIGDIMGVAPFDDGAEIQLRAGILKVADSFETIREKWQEEIGRMKYQSEAENSARKKIS